MSHRHKKAIDDFFKNQKGFIFKTNQFVIGKEWSRGNPAIDTQHELGKGDMESGQQVLVKGSRQLLGTLFGGYGKDSRFEPAEGIQVVNHYDPELDAPPLAERTIKNVPMHRVSNDNGRPGTILVFDEPEKFRREFVAHDMSDLDDFGGGHKHYAVIGKNANGEDEVVGSIETDQSFLNEPYGTSEIFHPVKGIEDQDVFDISDEAYDFDPNKNLQKNETEQ